MIIELTEFLSEKVVATTKLPAGKKISYHLQLFFFAILNILRIFALAFDRESCKQEKHCDTVL